AGSGTSLPRRPRMSQSSAAFDRDLFDLALSEDSENVLVSFELEKPPDSAQADVLGWFSVHREDDVAGGQACLRAGRRGRDAANQKSREIGALRDERESARVVEERLFVAAVLLQPEAVVRQVERDAKARENGASDLTCVLAVGEQPPGRPGQLDDRLAKRERSQLELFRLEHRFQV